MYCKNCGMDSSNPTTCEWCHKPIEAAPDASKPSAPPKASSAPAEPPVAAAGPQTTAPKVEKMERPQQTEKKKFLDPDDPKDVMLKSGIVAAVGVLIVLLFHGSGFLYYVGLAVAFIGGVPFVKALLQSQK